MKNLADITNADTYIREELEAAGIPVVQTHGEKHPEVPYSIGGELFGWTLRRQWYYWAVRATPGLPLPVARRLYDMDPRKEVRVAGHCMMPPPEEWTKKLNARGFRVIPDPDEEPPEKFHRMKLEVGGLSWDRDTAFEYVSSYHIDTQEGLNLWAKVVRETEAKIFQALKE